MVSAAACLSIARGKIAEARIALGGVAAKPWRARAAELILAGARADAALFGRAAQGALAHEQRMSALGALAAAAAHELGTPLSTIAVIAKEMQRDVETDDPLREDVDLLAQESGRCRSILARLTVDPAGDVSDAYVLVPLPALIEAAAQHYSRDDIGITFASGPIGEGVPTTAPIHSRTRCRKACRNFWRRLRGTSS